MQGKWDIRSDAKLVGREKFLKHNDIIYHLKGLSLLIIFTKDHDLKITQKINIWLFISGVRKNLKQGATKIHIFKHVQITNH